jgi:hypothetical protein
VGSPEAVHLHATFQFPRKSNWKIDLQKSAILNLISNKEDKEDLKIKAKLTILQQVARGRMQNHATFKCQVYLTC